MKALLLCLFLLFPLSLLTQDEMIGNQEIDEPVYQVKLKRQKRFFIDMGISGGFRRLNHISIGYHLNDTLSVGITQHHISASDFVFENNLEVGVSKYGLYSSDSKISYQHTPRRHGVPNLGQALFLHLYPFLKQDIPFFYVPIYFGRTHNRAIVRSSRNILSNAVVANLNSSSGFAVLNTTVNERSSLYYGFGLGFRIRFPQGIFLGIEYGLAYLRFRKFKHYTTVSPYNELGKNTYLRTKDVSMVDLYLYNMQIQELYEFPKQARLNYGIIVGVSF